MRTESRLRQAPGAGAGWGGEEHGEGPSEGSGFLAGVIEISGTDGGEYTENHRIAHCELVNCTKCK